MWAEMWASPKKVKMPELDNAVAVRRPCHYGEGPEGSRRALVFRGLLGSNATTLSLACLLTQGVVVTREPSTTLGRRKRPIVDCSRSARMPLSK